MSKIKHNATHEIISFTFSSGEVMARCKMPECSWGTGHEPSALYSGRGRKKAVEDLEEESEVIEDELEQEDDVRELSVADILNPPAAEPDAPAFIAESDEDSSEFEELEEEDGDTETEPA